MMRKVYKSLLSVALPLATLGTLACVSSVRAQSITPDGTLSTEVQSNDNLNFDITKGDRQGNNLFHSFKDFSVLKDGSARFLNPTDIANIFSRVTGGNISEINGLIQAQGTANLFLINPSGIIFGPNASLNIGGSFFGSTASSIVFDDGVEFSATDTQPSPLLTVNIPIGLRFRDNPERKSITVNSNIFGLQVSPGNTLAFVGGDVNFDNGGRIFAPGARVEIGGLAEAGTIELENNDGNFQLNFPTNVLLSDVTLANDGIVAANTTNDSRGDIVVNANLFEAKTGGRLLSFTQGAVDGGDITVNSNEVDISGVGGSGFGAGIYQLVLNNASGNGGKIIINTNSFNASSGGNIGNTVLSGGIGNAGDILINVSGDLSLKSGAQINSSTFGLGNAGNVTINVPNGNVNFDGVNTSFQNGVETLNNTGILNNVESGAKGNAGIIDIKARNISITEGAQIQSIVRGANPALNPNAGEGNAGKININIDEKLAIDGVSDIFTINGLQNSLASQILTNLEVGTKGKGGDIDITAGELSITNGAQLISSTFGEGDAGNIRVNIPNGNANFDGVGSVLLNGRQFLFSSGIQSNVESGAIGDAGNIDIKIQAGNLSITKGSQIQSIVSAGEGNTGKITIKVDDGTLNIGDIDDTGFLNLISTSYFGANSNSDVVTKQGAGNIEITATQLSMKNGARLTSETTGTRNAGNIQINVSGDITLNGDTFISSQTFGFGNAGKVTIDGIDGKLPKILFDKTDANNNQTFNGIFTAVNPLTSEPKERRIGGDINITAQSLKLANGAAINSSTFGKGNAGTISITVDDSITLTNSSLIASTVGAGAQGIGGDITLKGRSLSITDGSQVLNGVFRASDGKPGGKGKAGNIVIDMTDLVNISGVGSSRSGLFASAEAESIATESQAAGDITVTTGDFRIADGAVVTAFTANSGDGGKITINARNFTANNGGRIVTSTVNSGNAGDIKLTIADRVTIAGENSGIFARTFSTGKGGNIDIDPKTVEILDKAQISAESRGEGTAGDINIVSDEIVLLRRGGTISTFASESNAGKIDIKTGVLVTLPNENSDITASAANQGGTITIDALGIFGFEFRSQQDLQNFNVNNFTELPTSDISATGGNPTLTGTITVNNPETDPNNGLVELPETVVDAKKQVAQNACRQGGSSEFIATGRGGLPPNPTHDLTSSAVRVDLVTPVASKTTNTIALQPKSTPTARKIVPAQGWIFNSKGQVVLTAYDPNKVGVQRTAHKGLCRAK